MQWEETIALILVVTEKNDAATQIARLLSDAGAPKADKVYSTPIYRFNHKGDEWVTIGLRGHILAPDFPTELKFDEERGWYGVDADGKTMDADLPPTLPTPPFENKRRPYLADGINIKGWNVKSLPYLVWAPIEKVPAEKEIIRSLKNLAKKADAIVIGTDFDREGELRATSRSRVAAALATSAPQVACRRRRSRSSSSGRRSATPSCPRTTGCSPVSSPTTARTPSR